MASELAVWLGAEVQLLRVVPSKLELEEQASEVAAIDLPRHRVQWSVVVGLDPADGGRLRQGHPAVLIGPLVDARHR